MTRLPRAVGALLIAALALLTGLRAAWIAGHRQDLRITVGGDAAPPFELPLLAGGEFKLGEPPGEVTVIDFWASWCGPCREELPTVDLLARRYKDRARFIAVDTETIESKPAVEALVRSLGLSLPIALGGDEVAQRYKVESLPTLMIIGRSGTIDRVLVGVHGEDEIARLVDAALAAPR